MKLKCPKCKRRFQAPETMRGRVVRCPGCNCKIQLGTSKSTNPPPAAKNTVSRQRAPAARSATNTSKRSLSSKAGKPLPLFKILGRSLFIGGKNYEGCVIVSVESIYFLVEGMGDSVGRRVSMQFGLIGWLIYALTRSKPEMHDMSCKLGEIDRRLLDHPDWPLKVNEKTADWPVYIIPRNSVGVINHPKLSTLIQLQSNGAEFSFNYPSGKGAVVRDFLVDTRWPVVWNGENLSKVKISENPHDNSVGERYWTRVAVAVCILFALMVFLVLLGLLSAGR